MVGLSNSFQPWVCKLIWEGKIYFERRLISTQNPKHLSVTKYSAAAAVVYNSINKTFGRIRMDDATHLDPLSASWSASGVDNVEGT